VTTLSGEPVPASRPEGPNAAVAKTFLDGLATQDFASLASAFTDDVHLRALLPGGFREWDGVSELEARFARWFGDTLAYELVDTHVGLIGPRLSLRWRARLQAERLGPGWHVVEQEAYAEIGDHDQIERLSLVCSGYLAESGDG
jgi:hypothetical protein